MGFVEKVTDLGKPACHICMLSATIMHCHRSHLGMVLSCGVFQDQLHVQWLKIKTNGLIRKIAIEATIVLIAILVWNCSIILTYVVLCPAVVYITSVTSVFC